ncbi:chemotaxis protein CheX [Spirochaetia bacterium 38H-sp]|uniref:Chemotaxis protein CheX n=1 Tax=Rarispira pelagica TaxID=3141764 RepID=A0ABU9UE16_9SPIR
MEQKIKTILAESLRDILKETKIKTKQTIDPEEKNTKTEIISSLGIVGKYKGYGLLFFDKNTALKFTTEASRALGYALEGTTLTELHRSFILEFTNQLFGRLVSKLSTIGIDSMLTPPSLLMGNNLNPISIAKAQETTAKIEGNFGKIFIKLILKNK